MWGKMGCVDLVREGVVQVFSGFQQRGNLACQRTIVVQKRPVFSTDKSLFQDVFVCSQAKYGGVLCKSLQRFFAE